MNHGLPISLKAIRPGSMPERLMGTDCKFVGNMSTLVQIQLGPTIRQSITRGYNSLALHNHKYSMLEPPFHWVFHWDCSSIGQSTALSRRKLRVRTPSVPATPIKIHQSIHLAPYMTLNGGRGSNIIPKQKIKKGSLFP